MLRLLGIPARVAVGFTSGSLEDGAWTVTDTTTRTPGSRCGSTAGGGCRSIRHRARGLRRLLLTRVGLADAEPPGWPPVRPPRARTDCSRGGQSFERSRRRGRDALLARIDGARSSGRGGGDRARQGRPSLALPRHDPRRIASAARAELAERLVDQGSGRRRAPRSATSAGAWRFGLTGATFARATAVATAWWGPGRRRRRERRELRSLVRAPAGRCRCTAASAVTLSPRCGGV